MIRRLSDLPDEADVLIAGGGPSGLFLALDLAHRGIASMVLEPRVELDWTRPRAKTTNARTMTHLRRLGLADELRAAAPLPVAYSDSVIFCTSLVGHELTRFRNAFQLWSGRYPHQPECGQQVPQPRLERVLRAAVERSPHAGLALGLAYEGSASDDVGRIVTVRDAGGEARTIRCRYLVGADGVSSRVRRDLGLRLEGSSAAKSNLGVLFRSEQLSGRVRLDPAVQYWIVGDTYAGMVGPMDFDGLWWSIVQGYDPALPKFAGVPPTDVLRRLIGADVDLELVAQDPWTARMLLAPTYRAEAVFLVGDAAHANPPWGGHGFNTCIGDAANLAWKLAAELRGWAGPGLLDSYQAERRPVARRTIDEAAANGEVLADDLIDDDIDADGERGERSRGRAAELLAVKESEFSSLGLVLGYDYASSPLVTPAGASAPETDPIRYTPSAAPGCLLPHAWLAGRTSLYDLLDPGFTVLVDGAVAPVPDAVAQVASLAGARGIPLAVRVVDDPALRLAEVWQAPMLLVRPDQHVAWRGSDAGALAAALIRAVGGEPPGRTAA